MAAGNSIRDEIKEQNKKIKQMKGSQKREHIWEYYRFWIISVLAAIAIVVGVVMMIMRNNYDTVFTTIIVDGAISGMSDKTDKLTTGFTEYLGIDGTSTRVYFDNNYTLTENSPVPIDQDPYISAQKIVTLAASHSIDGYIAEYSMINYFSSNDDIFLVDLRDYLTPEEVEQLQDYFVYYTLKDGTKIPNALDLTNTKIMTETDLRMTKPCYGICVATTHADNAVAFIRYAFDLK